MYKYICICIYNYLELIILNRSILNLWKPNNINNKNIKNLNLNFGPNHPAAHGVLRLILKLNNEVVEDSDIHIGLLHRGTEKLIESKNYLKSLPYFDRLDYVSMMSQEHIYCLAIEELTNNKNTLSTVSLVRVLFDELTRILNHLLALSCHILDIGCMSPIFWGFEEREKIFEFYERVSGARMHAAFYRPNKNNFNQINFKLLNDISYFCNNFFYYISEVNNLLLKNKIWKTRLINNNILNKKFIKSWKISGVMGRSAGVKEDIRIDKNLTYANYKFLNFKSYIGKNGDSYDRFIIRLNEQLESINIINKVLKNIKKKKNNKILSKFFFKKNSMENLISHFKYWSFGFNIKKNNIYKFIESPKGSYGLALFSDNTNKPYRCKINSPSFYHMQALKPLLKNNTLADLITLMGTIDIVFGEIDR